MRIHRLEVEGFRSLKKVSWEPGALNVVIGPNGSGKSNLLKCLEVLLHGSKGLLRKHIQVNGGIYHATWNNEPLEILIVVHIEGEHQPDVMKDIASYHVYITSNIKENDYTISSEFIESVSDDGFSRTFPDSRIWIGGEHKLVKTQDLISEHEFLLSIAKSPYQLGFLPFRFQGFFSTLSISKILDTSEQSDIRHSTFAAYEKQLLSDGSNLIQVLHTLYTHDRAFKSDLDAAMSAAFGNDYEELVFAPASDQRIQMRIRWRSLNNPQSALDISDGTLRFLYLLAILANPEPAPLIAIDEPETGLHPSMFPIVAEFAAEASKKSQVIFTTHSDQFLTACGPFAPTVTVASWTDGQTHLKVVDNEQLTDWLKHYSLGALFRSGELEDLA